MWDTIFTFAIPTLLMVSAVNLYAYATTRNKISLTAGLLLLLSGMGLLFLMLPDPR